MDRLTVLTHLVTILTAFAAFTVPIALEVLNRIKGRYGSASYMEVIEEIMGFTIRSLFGRLIAALIFIIFSILILNSTDSKVIPDNIVVLIEGVFAVAASVLLLHEVIFIKTVLLATRSDKLVLDYLISKISTPSLTEQSYNDEVELLVQIARYNIENTVAPYKGSIEERLFVLIEDSYSGKSSIGTQTIRGLLDGLSVTLNSTRNTQRRDRYISYQRDYGHHLILFIDRKLGGARSSWANNHLYEETDRELNSDSHWLAKADFLAYVNIWDIRNPNTLAFIDGHIYDTIELLVLRKPELVAELIENYRQFIHYEGHFQEELHNLSSLFGDYNPNHFNEIYRFTETHKDKLSCDPQSFFNEFILLLDKFVQDKLSSSSHTEVERLEILSRATKYEGDMLEEMIKEVSALYARRTTQYAIRALASKSLWKCILDCQESFNPAASGVHMLGIELLPVSMSSIVQELGKSYGFRRLEAQELNLAYIRATPLLVMYVLYRWRLQNLTKNVHTFIASTDTNLHIGEQTIRNAQRQLESLDKVIYFAKSSTYAEVFCSYFGIEHETQRFKNAVIPILEKAKKNVNDKRINMIDTQKLSEDVQNRFIENCFVSQRDIFETNPLLKSYSLTYYKPEGFRVSFHSYRRFQFLDDTDVHQSFNHYRLLDKLHNAIALKAINERGLDLATLDLNKMDDNDLLVISHKDWQNIYESIDKDKYGDLKLHTAFSKKPLGKYYIHNTKSDPLVTLYHPVIGDTNVDLLALYKASYEFNFEESDGLVNITANVYIDY
ncbi:hypothetical protein L3Q72_13135 [Vibrio sp. JC009]|uniref:hypothetical protein n=1 Tax=Vibrio sp. JC009 TaxID=2912314 RepID=UPI0023AED699|nr:hypothetical protein [Vibrio sp. JC009]WED21557.1 hypothetical protein L3Q72_13135 [Vibrio sp. JC009]